MKRIGIHIIVAVFIVMITNSSAIAYPVVLNADHVYDFLMYPDLGNFYEDFNFEDMGYNPETDIITDYDLSIKLADDEEGADEYLRVRAYEEGDGWKWIWAGEVDSGWMQFDVPLFWWWTDADGKLNASFSYNCYEGDINLRGSHLELSVDRTDPIPEPTTMFLLGSGLIGLAGVRRKFKK